MLCPQLTDAKRQPHRLEHAHMHVGLGFSVQGSVRAVVSFLRSCCFLQRKEQSAGDIDLEKGSACPGMVSPPL